MKPLADYATFLELDRQYSRKVGNDYLLPGAVQSLIASGKLSYIALPGGLFLFEQRDNYQKLYFRLMDTALSLPKMDCALVAYTVYKGDPTDGITEAWLTQNGFAVRRTRLRYAADTLNVTPSLNGISHADADEAYPVYRTCFSDLLTADLPCPEQFEGAYCLRDDAGQVMGVLSKGQNRHIAVLPAYRGRGVAARLYGGWMTENHGKIRVWTDVDNPAANAMYRKLGFLPDGMTARCYVKE